MPTEIVQRLGKRLPCFGCCQRRSEFIGNYSGGTSHRSDCRIDGVAGQHVEGRQIHGRRELDEELTFSMLAA